MIRMRVMLKMQWCVNVKVLIMQIGDREGAVVGMVGIVRMERIKRR